MLTPIQCDGLIYMLNNHINELIPFFEKLISSIKIHASACLEFTYALIFITFLFKKILDYFQIRTVVLSGENVLNNLRKTQRVDRQ